MNFSHYSDRPAELAVDLVNTVQTDGDQISSTKQLKTFLAEYEDLWQGVAKPPKARDLIAIHELRAALREVLETDNEARASELINEILAEHGATPRVSTHSGTPHLHFEPVGTSISSWLGAITAMGLATIIIECGVERSAYVGQTTATTCTSTRHATDHADTARLPARPGKRSPPTGPASRNNRPAPMALSDKRLSTFLVSLGTLAIIASLVFGVGGFLTLSSLLTGASTTVRSASVVVDDVAVATDAAALSVTSIREVIDDVESAARSGARTLLTVEGLLTDIADQAAEDVAAGIESAVNAMPGIIQTGRVINRTLSALSFVGVDYDPAVPLDEALESLEQSLAPLPGEIREQVELLEEAARDIAVLSENSSSLAASLLEIRIDLLEAEGLVADAAVNVDVVSRQFAELADDFDTYRVWLPWLVVAAAIAIAAIGVGLLLIGLNEKPDRT